VDGPCFIAVAQLMIALDATIASIAGAQGAAFVHGFSVATAWGAGILLLAAALVAAVLINPGRAQPHRVG
jgi:hypothetical protein